MSEDSETPQGVSNPEPNRSNPLTRAMHLGRLAKRVALSGNYATDVAPQDYEAYVRKMDREKLAGQIVGVMQEYVSPLSEDRTKRSVLDVAAGTGIISHALQEAGYQVTATDLSDKSLAFLKERTPSIETVQADMNHPLPFAEGSFDGITTVWANRFISDTPAFLSEMHRVIKDGSVFVWPIFPSERSFWKWETRKPFQHTVISSLAKDAQKAGFSVISERKAPLLKNLISKGGLPPHTTPGYLILKK
jgi:ubiquinone/menaquinone biosynthesis C-methylase UbiE